MSSAYDQIWKHSSSNDALQLAVKSLPIGQLHILDQIGADVSETMFIGHAVLLPTADQLMELGLTGGDKHTAYVQQHSADLLERGNISP